MKKAATTAGSGQQIRVGLTLSATEPERRSLYDWMRPTECWEVLARAGAAYRPQRVARAARALNLTVMWSPKGRRYLYTWDELLQIAEYLSQEVR